MHHCKLRSHSALWCLALLFAVWTNGQAQSSSDIQLAQTGQAPLKELSLEQLGTIEVTTATKNPRNPMEDSRRDLCDHTGGHPPFRYDQHS